MFGLPVHLDLSRSNSKVRVIDQSSPSQDENISGSAMNTHYEMTRMMDACYDLMCFCPVLCAKMVGMTSNEGFLVI